MIVLQFLPAQLLNVVGKYFVSAGQGNLKNVKNVLINHIFLVYQFLSNLQIFISREKKFENAIKYIVIKVKKHKPD